MIEQPKTPVAAQSSSKPITSSSIRAKRHANVKPLNRESDDGDSNKAFGTASPLPVKNKIEFRDRVKEIEQLDKGFGGFYKSFYQSLIPIQNVMLYSIR